MQYYFTDELYHHGIKGMKWGVRKRTAYGNAAEIVRRRNNMIVDLNDKYRDNKSLNKQRYKAGEISKESYKKFKKENKKNYRKEREGLYNQGAKQYYNRVSRGKALTEGLISTVAGIGAIGAGTALSMSDNITPGKMYASVALLGLGGASLGVGLSDIGNEMSRKKYTKKSKSKRR